MSSSPSEPTGSAGAVPPYVPPFPDRITAGSARSAAALQRHSATAARWMERTLAHLQTLADVGTDSAADRGRAARGRAAHAARRYAEAARQYRAYESLADLHLHQACPAPLFTVRTRRHVSCLLNADRWTATLATDLRSALGWTRGLPMPPRLGFAAMRAAFEHLGLLAPVALPDLVTDALRAVEPAAVPTPREHVAPEPAASSTERPAPILRLQPTTPQAFMAAVEAESRSRFDDPARGLVARFPSIDFAAAFEAGISVSAAITTVERWIVHACLVGSHPFSWSASRRNTLPGCDAEGRGDEVPLRRRWAA